MTIKDVAAAAGVSVATVSRALNAPHTIAPATLERVSAVISETGYTPNKIARSLKVQTSKSVAIVVPDISNPFQVKIIKGAESVLSEAGYTLFIMDTEENPAKEERFLRDLLDRQIDGLLYVPVLTDKKLPSVIANRDLPVVMVDRYLGNRHDCVRGNNFAGVSLLFNYLLSREKSRIAFIGGPEDSLVGHERNEAFRSLCRTYNLSPSADSFLLGDFTAASGYRLAQTLAEGLDRIDSVIIANNLMGIGALKSFRDRGVQVPQDLEIAIFDEIGDLIDPPVTHVRQQSFEMGAQAARFLMDRMGGRGESPRNVLFEPVLFVAPRRTQP